MHRRQGREGQLLVIPSVPALREATGVCDAGVGRAELGRRPSGCGKGGKAKKGQ